MLKTNQRRLISNKSYSKMRLVIVLLVICVINMAKSQDYSEKYRLQVHFSVPFGWANDPNGIVYHDGQYHLFYQHDPNSTKHGPMHWGHAQSTDLVHWENLPVALKPYGQGTIFSGCCVVDSKNVTGITGANPEDTTLIALYTFDESGNQSQAMAYSFDNGLTWTHYENNPVIANPNLQDFRDPNVFERNNQYYMALAAGEKIMFYASTDLLSWTFRSEFGLQPNQGDKSGVWECPTVVSLADETGTMHDVLIISENGLSRGSLMQYFIGTFEDTGFTSDSGDSKVFWADHGPDNYAAVPYHNDPKNRSIWIGWMANWLYAQETPTPNWRGQMTIPRELSLRTVDGQLFLAQRPVDEFSSIFDPARLWALPSALTLSGEETVDITTQIPFRTNGLLSLEYVLNVNAANAGKIGFRFSNNLGEFVSFYYDIEDRSYEFDRRFSGKVVNERFAQEIVRANRIAAPNTLTGQIILDTAAIEIFADGGLNTFTALFFPTVPFENIQIYAALKGVDAGKSITIESLNVTALNGIWS